MHFSLDNISIPYIYLIMLNSISMTDVYCAIDNPSILFIHTLN